MGSRVGTHRSGTHRLREASSKGSLVQETYRSRTSVRGVSVISSWHQIHLPNLLRFTQNIVLVPWVYRKYCMCVSLIKSIFNHQSPVQPLLQFLQNIHHPRYWTVNTLMPQYNLSRPPRKMLFCTVTRLTNSFTTCTIAYSTSFSWYFPRFCTLYNLLGPKYNLVLAVLTA